MSEKTMNRQDAALKLAAIIGSDPAMHIQRGPTQRFEALAAKLTDLGIDLILEADALRAQITEKDLEEMKLLREIAGPKWEGCDDVDFLEQFDPYAALAEKDREIERLEATVKREMGEDYLSLQALYVQQLGEIRSLKSDLSASQAREREAVERAEKAEKDRDFYAEMRRMAAGARDHLSRCNLDLLTRVEGLESALAAVRKALEAQREKRRMWFNKADQLRGKLVRAEQALTWIYNRSRSIYGCSVQELGKKAEETLAALNGDSHEQMP